MAFLYVHLLLRLILVLPTALFIFPFAFAAVITVGGDEGWVVGAVNYTRWSANHTFYAGDSLVFNYQPQVHTVLQVTHASYINCAVSNPLASHIDGNTTVYLKDPGSYYFICGVYEHCPLGQKLEVAAEELPKEAPKSAPVLTSGAPESARSPISSSGSGSRSRIKGDFLVCLLMMYLLT